MSQSDDLKQQLTVAFQQLPKPVSDTDILTTARSILADDLVELNQFETWFEANSARFMKSING